MFGFFGAGPDPAGMTCAEIIKGYETNQRLAKERSPKHRKQHEARVKELKPFYERCTAEQAAAPILEQGQEMQAVIDQIYDSGAPASAVRGTLPTMSMTTSGGGGGALIDFNKILLVAGMGVGVFLVYRVLKKRRTAS